ncbi:MAG: hypothetical protein JSC189_001220 [Candidatus Tokpelaia sp. JSC189]|nr:MAG: hypothetical protein JSC189_001220 [Candidatus Tokpelaia sp. JSC189]
MLEKTADALIELAVQPLEKNRFAPFGDIIYADPSHMRFINNGTTKRYHDLCQVEAYGKNTSVLINIFRSNGFSLPININMVERHPYGSQAFFPLDKRPFLVVVAEDNAGTPQTPQAFLAQPRQGINYRANTWHHPLLTLYKTADFLVIDCKKQENNLEEYFYNTTYRIANLNCYRSDAQPMKIETISLDYLNTTSAKCFCSILSGIFEHSPWVAKRILSKRPFESIEALYYNMVAEVAASSEDEKLTLIRAHPELAGKAAQKGALTTESIHEQKEAGLDTLNEEEFSEFHKLNKAYKKRFGFPCIIAARGFEKIHNKHSILANIRERLQNTQDEENREALRQIARIAELRLKDLVGE